MPRPEAEVLAELQRHGWSKFHPKALTLLAQTLMDGETITDSLVGNGSWNSNKAFLILAMSQQRLLVSVKGLSWMGAGDHIGINLRWDDVV